MAEQKRREATSEQRAMHRRLTDLGVVDRVRHALLADKSTTGITDLICWVERKRGGVFVRAAFERGHVGTHGQGGKSFDGASFRVEQDKPFGTITDRPLSSKTVDAVLALAEQSR